MRELSVPLRCAIGLAVAAVVLWAVVVVLDQIFEVDADLLSVPLLLALAGVVVSAAVELVRHRNRWVRGIGVVMISGVVISALIVALLLWYAVALCGDGGCS